jgi:hypothetical protein
MTTGDAYRKAIELHGSRGEEGAHVAAENADTCRATGDMNGVLFWLKVSEFVQFLNSGIQ